MPQQPSAASMPSHASAQLIADLHLNAQEPATAAAFERFVLADSAKAEALFILGDLFDYWAGDDDMDDVFNAHIIALLRHAASQTKLYFMHGNRDFLIGEHFAKAAQLTLLDDPTMVSIAGQSYLLSHGDVLCTDDHAYQAFRAQVRNKAWQDAILARPLAERKALAQQLRQQSQDAKSGKTMLEMDVNETAVHEFMQAHGAHELIHGHTHRPAHHVVTDSTHQPALTQSRRVLSDWHWDGIEQRGNILHIGTAGITLHEIPA
ncbi:UDP-2,3-diacylglucosamine diphosphatase [Ampullimonas aquatilis]|uniref:UDP-2,3-diacylglucosamine diphosphatase n=1 Tax=Ampullimonas aquatilis TaxID=1341549 RepID=UPI003C790EA1